MNCERCNLEIDVTKLSRWTTGRFCSRHCANSRTFSDTAKLKKSLALKGKPQVNGRKAKTEIRVCSVCKITTFEARLWQKKKTCSNECHRRAPGQGGYHPNSTRKIRSEYKGYWMDSGSEREFAELMDANNIKWHKNTTKSFPYTDRSGKSRKYIPDFYLPDYDYWVEVKGLYYINENDDLKLKSVGNNIEMQMHNDIKLPKCNV